MIERVIDLSVRFFWLVIPGGIALAIAGAIAVWVAPIDAIPDLSETQLLVYTPWQDKRPQEIERAITLPLSAGLRDLPGVRTVRGSSEENFSLLHLIFHEGVSMPEARTLVADRLRGVAGRLPRGVVPTLAPDAPATGQVFWYTVEGEGHDLVELRAIQDRLIKPRLSMVPGVAEVATIGGLEQELQLLVQPRRLAAVGLGVNDVLHQLRTTPISGVSKPVIEDQVLRVPHGQRVRVGELADVEIVPAPRQGMFEKDGNEVVGGVALMNHGWNPLNVIHAIRSSIDELSPQLPAGVRIITAHDRTPLIRGATKTVATALLEAMLTAGICVVIVTRHLRASLVVVLTLPLAVLSAFVALWLLRVLDWMDLPVNIMSLAGITISIGVLVDSSIVMAENVMHRLHRQFDDEPVTGDVSHLVAAACRSVGRPIFFSVVIMLLSFLPVFALEGIEGKMFRPLAVTKSFALAASAILAITFVPALCVVLIRGRMIAERRSWFVRSLIDVYQPTLNYSLDHPLPLFFVLAFTFLAGTAPLGDRRVYLVVTALVIVGIWWAARTRWSRIVAVSFVIVLALFLERSMTPLDREFLTPLDEGTAMDMPITVPGIAAAQAVDDLKARNMVLCRFPEVEMVMGKVGRAETATDPAPLDMIETMINFRQREFWPRRKVSDSQLRSRVTSIHTELERQGLCRCANRAESVERIEAAVQAINFPFHAALRDYAWHRNQDCIREASVKCLQVLAESIAKSRGVPASQAVVGLVPPDLASRFGDDWSGDLVLELARRMSRDPAGTQTGDSANQKFELTAEQLKHLRQVVYEARRDLWREHVDRLDAELRQRAGRTLVFLTLVHFLSSEELADTELRSEVDRIVRYRTNPSKGARRVHHGIVELAAPDTDPTPKFDALCSSLTERVGNSLMLRACERSEIAGFGGEMDDAVTMPGWTNVWTMPIQNRVDMLATGVNTTVGIRVLGPGTDAVVNVSERIAELIRQIPGASGVVADPVRGRRVLTIRPKWDAARSVGVSRAELQSITDVILGGAVAIRPEKNGQRQVVRLRFSPEAIANPDEVKRLPVVGKTRGKLRTVSLGEVADVELVDQPASLKSENGQARNYVRFNVRGRDDAELVEEARRLVASQIKLPDQVSLEWTGEFEQRLRAQSRLQILLPIVLFVIFAVLWITYHDLTDAVLMVLSAPGALAGGVLMQWFFGYSFSVTVTMGYVACLGMATSTGIIMLVYLRESLHEAGPLQDLSLEELKAAVLRGAVFRLRPKLLTEATTILGLAPMLWASGIGAEVIRPMAVPVLGGILVADEIIDLLLPVLFFWVRRRRWEKLQETTLPASSELDSLDEEMIHACVLPET